MHATLPLLEQTDFPAIKRGKLQTLQVNLGYRCNQQCLHCHVNAGPRRKENMTRETVDQVIAFLKTSKIKNIDLTGGAPELNPNFQYLVTEARKLGIHVIDRCNLTILFEPEQQVLASFLADNHVEIAASLPCYLKENVDIQRGKGVFDISIQGLKKLNQLGYGQKNSSLILNLMYNPQGPTLPPSQESLETTYREYLKTNYDIVFSNLYTITNMPIQRFGSTLISNGTFNDYMQLLRENFSQTNLTNVMCRNLISIDWQGYLYDCDFNQMLNLPTLLNNRPKNHISNILNQDISGQPITVKDHCFGCTAGQGSSCGGAL